MTEGYTAPPLFTLTSGPVPAYPAVLRALSRPVEYDHDPYFLDFYERVNAKATAALRCAGPALILQGEPILAIEAAAASLIGRDDVVLNLVSGVYGKGFGPWARRHCRELVEIEVPFNEAIDPAAVADMLRRRPEIAVVVLCHHDTPSGTINPAHEIGRIVRDHGAAFMVDAVSSFGGMDVHPDDIGADVFIAGPGKCLGGTPGLSLLAVSDRGWAKIAANPDAPRASVLSLLDWREAHHAHRPFPFTPSIAEVNGLDAALDLYAGEGPAAVWARHALTARACRAGLRAMGLELWPAREAIAAPTATALRLPDGIDDGRLLAAARRLYGVVLSAGRGATAGKLIRIGHMGPTAHPMHAVIAITAIGGALRSLGFGLDLGAGVAATTEVIDFHG
jgi:pyridoxamine--pyruvate transaminase